MLWNAITIDPLNVFITPTVRGPRFAWMTGEANGLERAYLPYKPEFDLLMDMRVPICHKNQSLIC